MVNNLTIEEIHDFITNDFKGAWDSLAASANTNIGRGNFMFALQAMNLLEFICRLYSRDTRLRTTFSNELRKIEPKYFTRLPSPCANIKEFTLPHVRNNSGDLLLWALFDLIRNGVAHQYQQIMVKLKNRRRFLSVVGKTASHHLDYYQDQDGDIGLKVYPEILFLDLERALQESHILTRISRFEYLNRPLRKRGKKRRNTKHMTKKFYDFGVRDLKKSLLEGGHSSIDSK